MRTYKIRLLKCSGKDQKISAYLQLLTGLDKVMANRIVSNLPATLFDNLDEEGMEYFKEAFDFYEVEYEITPLEEDLSMAPFLIRDGMDAEKAVKLQQELTNIGIRSQVIRSGSPVTERKRKKFFQRLLSSEV